MYRKSKLTLQQSYIYAIRSNKLMKCDRVASGVVYSFQSAARIRTNYLSLILTKSNEINFGHY